jgi:cell division protein FtsL
MKKPQSLMSIIVNDLLGTHWLLVVVILAVTSTAIAVTWSTQQNRNLNAELARLLVQQTSYENDWRKLRLEHRALAEHARVEQLARQKLNMVPVVAEKETILK